MKNENQRLILFFLEVRKRMAAIDTRIFRVFCIVIERAQHVFKIALQTKGG